jgi:hypothetical protein
MQAVLKRQVCCGSCLDELMLQEGAGRPQRPAPLEGVRNHHLPFELPHRAFGFVPPLKLLIHLSPPWVEDLQGVGESFAREGFPLPQLGEQLVTGGILQGSLELLPCTG